jgi:plastocyanin
MLKCQPHRLDLCPATLAVNSGDNVTLTVNSGKPHNHRNAGGNSGKENVRDT